MAKPSTQLSSSNGPSKLPRFLQKQSRDRSKSMTDPNNNPTTTISPSTSEPIPNTTPKPPRKGNRKETPPPISPVNSMDEPPVIIEPVPVPRARTRSERPASDISPSSYSPTSTGTRIGDLPTRLSGWFSHTFSTSSTDLSLPSLLSQSSPKAKASSLLTAAKRGGGHLDKAVRYLLDSDATPDKCTDPIWILGVQHPGYEPPPFVPILTRRSSIDSRRHSPSSFRSSSSSELSQSQPSNNSSSKHSNPANNWPPVFYADFTSRIWLTYRSQFTPIRDLTLGALEGDDVGSSPPSKRTFWGGEKCWTTDAGWGCMLRTGQSLLANALLNLHLGRDWRRPPYPVLTVDYATYVQIITWFFDSPSPYAPFSVHRMALAGKDLGTDVGQWFGPSIAAGAIKTLVNAFPEAGIGVSVATDGTVFESEVFTASHSSVSRRSTTSWGDRAVLVLVGIRLGLDGVNPVYYDSVKALYTFPQSVGIAGGRPSSSYYFVGSQADNLFYLDPHHARPAIPLRPPPNTKSWRRDASQSRSPTTPLASSTSSKHTPISPSPLQQQFSSSSSSTSTSTSSSSQSPPKMPPHSNNSNHPHAHWQSSSLPASSASDLDFRDLSPNLHLDGLQAHYASVYTPAELKTFHCERVRKMPLSGLDPSMLIGFLCRDEADWKDLRRRDGDMSAKYRPIFTIQDEPPSWPSGSDDEMGLESISEPDDMDFPMDLEDEEGRRGEGRSEKFFDSPEPEERRTSQSSSADLDTEDSDPMGPITPGPGRSSFDVGGGVVGGKGRKMGDVRRVEDEFDEDDDEGNMRDADDSDDDWVDPSLPTPVQHDSNPFQHPPPSPPLPPLPDSRSPSPPPVQFLQTPKSEKTSSSSGSNATRKKPKKSKNSLPYLKTPTQSAQPPSATSSQSYPFPRSTDDASPPPQSQSYYGEKMKRMHTARARDGGRTQSGGVKGVLTEGEF